MNILIVDDDPASRIILGATLKKFGHQVTESANGAEALAAFDKEVFPVLISDLVMADVDGLELCRRIRAAGRSQYTYILLLTTVGGKYGYLVGMRAGADDFVTKPFDEEMLAARLAVADRILGLLSQVKQLSGLLPICALCKKIRDDKNTWHEVESYVGKRTRANFTHSYCPECSAKVLREAEPAPARRHSMFE